MGKPPVPTTMIRNATILRITRADEPGPMGESAWTPSGEELAIRCSYGTPTRRQRYELGSVITDATAMLRVLDADLAGLGKTIGEGDQVVLRPDGRTSKTYRVVHVIDSRKHGLSNWQAFLAEI